MAKRARTESSRVRFTEPEFELVKQYSDRCGAAPASMLRQLALIGMAAVLQQQNECLPNVLVQALPVGNAIAMQALAREPQAALV